MVDRKEPGADGSTTGTSTTPEAQHLVTVL